MLFDTDLPMFQIGWPALAATAIVSAILVIATIQIALKIRTRKVTTGIETLIGQQGEAISSLEKHGQVKVGGEIWAAKANADIGPGDIVTVTGVDGLKIEVEKA